MSNGRAWCKTELEQVERLLADGGELRAIATKIDRTPEALLLRAHKVLKRSPPSATCQDNGSPLGFADAAQR